jgi:hypothetical protein
MALITSTSDPVLHAALVTERAKFEAEAGWVVYQNLHYKVWQTATGEVAFEHEDSEEAAKSTSF